LIHETALSMTDVALASGFGSVRRFNETFRALYGRGPRELRRVHASAASPASGLSLLLRYRPPYDWPAVLDFLAVRAIPGVERVADGSYSRVVEVDGQLGTIEVSHAPREGALRVGVRLFDLGANPTAINATLARDPLLAPLIDARPGLRVPGGWDGFEIAVRAIVGQQITVKGGVYAAARLARTLGRSLGDGAAAPGLTHAFPGPERFAHADPSAMGMPRARALALVGLAATAIAQPDLFFPHGSLESAVARLRTLPGIGEWTAQYVAMRALRESDAFLAGDVALRRILATGGARPNARDLLARSDGWRPWRAYAVLHLWTSEVFDAALSA
jgi:AraC family transcriptional regulator of adaptative response / DNA-3-methyladenine glycosylase II